MHIHWLDFQPDSFLVLLAMTLHFDHPIVVTVQVLVIHFLFVWFVSFADIDLVVLYESYHVDTPLRLVLW